MLQKKTMIIFLVCMLMVSVALAGAVVSQASSLSGKVVSVVQNGASVKEGDVLLKVNTVSGAAPAVRASVNGTVSAVLVNTGDTVKAGQEVIKIQTN